MIQYSEDTAIKVALSKTKGVTSVMLRYLVDRDVALESLFGGNVAKVLETAGVSDPGLSDYILAQALGEARKEMEFMERHRIRPLFFLDDDFPYRLSEIPDVPVMLYKLGDADLNADKMVSVVGTRRSTAMGQTMTQQLVEGMAEMFPGLCVVSGMAYGIDAAAHRAALDRGLPTIGVLAHGLHMIYPAAHRDLAKRILSVGGALLSEYPYGAAPYRGSFLERNRIVAGMCDATIVVESEVKGGAMSTARCADEYNRSVFAVPGRPTDKESTGCNSLIRRHRAEILCQAADLVEAMGWDASVPTPTETKSLFPELNGDNKRVYDCVYASDAPCQLDVIQHTTGLPVAQVMAILSELEFDGVLVRHPGNRYSTVK